MDTNDPRRGRLGCPLLTLKGPRLIPTLFFILKDRDEDANGGGEEDVV